MFSRGGGSDEEVIDFDDALDSIPVGAAGAAGVALDMDAMEFGVGDSQDDADSDSFDSITMTDDEADQDAMSDVFSRGGGSDATIVDMDDMMDSIPVGAAAGPAVPVATSVLFSRGGGSDEEVIDFDDALDPLPPASSSLRDK